MPRYVISRNGFAENMITLPAKAFLKINRKKLGHYWVLSPNIYDISGHY